MLHRCLSESVPGLAFPCIYVYCISRHDGVDSHVPTAHGALWGEIYGRGRQPDKWGAREGLQNKSNFLLTPASRPPSPSRIGGVLTPLKDTAARGRRWDLVASARRLSNLVVEGPLRSRSPPSGQGRNLELQDRGARAHAGVMPGPGRHDDEGGECAMRG